MSDLILINEVQPVNSKETDNLEIKIENHDEKGLTKTQLKKKLKLENIMKKRVEKRKKERENKKLKRLLKKTIENEGPIISRNKLKQNLMINSTNKLKIVVDCSFENLMNDNDISHLCKQLQFCYAANRRLNSPLQFYITDYNSKLKTILEKMGANNWDIHKKEESYLKFFADEIEKGNVCYLTSDSPNELNEFDENKIYVIGGLVDHNHHKSMCFNIALKNNLQHYQLPISKYMNMKTRQVLTVNQVFELICNYTECNDWKQSFIKTLPKRKGAEIKENKTNTFDNNSYTKS